MAEFISKNYPQFSDIKIEHFDGLDPGTVLVKVLEFINDPAHADYRWINSHVDYFAPSNITAPVGSNPEQAMWVEITLVYTE